MNFYFSKEILVAHSIFPTVYVAIIGSNWASKILN